MSRLTNWSGKLGRRDGGDAEHGCSWVISGRERGWSLVRFPNLLLLKPVGEPRGSWEGTYFIFVTTIATAGCVKIFSQV